MAPKRRKLVRRAPRPIEIEDEEELELEEEEEEVVAPVTRGKVSRRPVVEEDDDEEEYEEEEEEDVDMPPAKFAKGKPAPVAKGKAAPAPAPKKRPVVEEDEYEQEAAPVKVKAVKLEKVDATMLSSIIVGIVNALDAGQAISVQQHGGDLFTITSGKAQVMNNRMKGNDYWMEVSSPEYRKWNDEWRQKTYDEKVKFARKNKLTWNEHENPRVDVIRLTEAVREHLGIEKYKPEYRSRSARADIRG